MELVCRPLVGHNATLILAMATHTSNAYANSTEMLSTAELQALSLSSYIVLAIVDPKPLLGAQS